MADTRFRITSARWVAGTTVPLLALGLGASGLLFGLSSDGLLMRYMPISLPLAAFAIIAAYLINRSWINAVEPLGLRGAARLVAALILAAFILPFITAISAIVGISLGSAILVISPPLAAAAFGLCIIVTACAAAGWLSGMALWLIETGLREPPPAVSAALRQAHATGGAGAATILALTAFVAGTGAAVLPLCSRFLSRHYRTRSRSGTWSRANRSP
jgi:hypothetical protein